MVLKVTFLFLFLQLCIIKAHVNSHYPGVYQLTEPIDLGKSAVWDSRNKLLYFVNIYKGQVFKFNPATNALKSITLDGSVTPVIPSRNDPDLIIVGLNRSLVAVEWGDESNPSKPKVLSTVSKEFPSSRFNNGKVDKHGRLWIRTMGEEYIDGVQTPNQGALYKFSCSNLDSPEVEIAPVTVSNGLAWNSANDKFFYIDTPTRKIVEYDYDDEAGKISNRKVVFDMKEHADKVTGQPDDMTIDEDDNLWVTLFRGGSVIKIDSKTGELLQIVPLPARDVTSAVWGGPDMDILYVTTARFHLSPQQRLEQPSAGAVFAVTGLGTKGLPAFDLGTTGSEDHPCQQRSV